VPSGASSLEAVVRQPSRSLDITVSLLDRLSESDGDLDQALKLAGKETADTMRAYYAMINEDKACTYNQNYRNLRSNPSFPRAADAEMALFGLSLFVWP
jgi:hypothetical protein